MHLGLPEEIDPSLFRYLPDGVDVTRIGNELTGELRLDMWVLPLHPKQAAAARPHIRSVHVVQSQYAGVDAFLSLVPPGATLCDAQGVHDIPVAEWILAAILASLKYIPFYVHLQAAGDWKQRIGAESLYLGTHPGAQPIREVCARVQGGSVASAAVFASCPSMRTVQHDRIPSDLKRRSRCAACQPVETGLSSNPNNASGYLCI